MAEKIKFVLLFFLGLCLGRAELFAAGQSALAFLKIVPGARASALGETYAGLAQGPEAPAFNAAGLAGEGRKQVSLQHSFFVEGILYDNIVYVHPHTTGVWAAQVGFLNVKGLKRTVANASSPDGFSELENVSTNNLLAAVFYSRRLPKRLSVGLGAKFLRESLHDQNSSAAAFDLGIMYKDLNLPLDVGIALQHLGAHDLPHTLRAGLALRRGKKFLPAWLHENSLFALDVSRSLEGHDPAASAGIEIPLQDGRIAARAGYRYPLNRQHLGHQLSVPNGLAMGFGVKFSGWNADYSATSFGDLGLTHRLSLTLGIGS
ncbi:MAG: hypothetical protein A2901_00190 [Elusimicrobia bacterium RIFCSPLOWO2_01_FULL_54_10]|nr:MAG: hypothetical protein A2901_00190 [Elusimicrobia bacterium RIFCSPLOWO2_01_FULL_54_10]